MHISSRHGQARHQSRRQLQRHGRRAGVIGIAGLVAVGLAACVSSAGASEDGSSVQLGLFPNVTHAPALVGIEEGFFADRLGDGAELDTFTFDSGTEAIEAMLSGALDITFIGPNPAINAYARSDGAAIRIVAGSTSGGSFLVVRPQITSIEQLRGTTLATPSLGNTQDVALRAWLADNGFETTPEGGGDVTIVPQKNSTTLEAFIGGAIDGAWVPEPWATRLIEDGGGRMLVDEGDLWAATDGRYVTAHMIVRTAFLDQHPELVEAVLNGLADSIELIERDPAAARADVTAQIASITGTPPDADLIEKCFANLTFTLDPVAVSLDRSATAAVGAGLLAKVDLTGIHDLTLLNKILAERGEPKVRGL